MAMGLMNWLKKTVAVVVTTEMAAPLARRP